MHYISARTITQLLAEPGSAMTRVYLAMLLASTQGSPVVHTSIRRLADESGLTERTVFAALADLQGCGLIRRMQRDPGPNQSAFLICDYEQDSHDSAGECADGSMPDANEGFDTGVVDDAVPSPYAGEHDVIETVIAGGDTAVLVAAQDETQNIPILSSGCSQAQCSGECEQDDPEAILSAVASCYRALDASESSALDQFIEDFVDGDRQRFWAAVSAVKPGVASDSPLSFFLAVIQRSDQLLRCGGADGVLV
jgi:hypothetical protein